MFSKNTYQNRRLALKNEIKSGYGLFLGNQDVPFNYNANIYSFRQDSTFLYLFGLNMPNIAGIIDFETGKDYIFGNDVDMDDIIWMGNLPTMKELADKVGVEHTLPLTELDNFISQIIKQGKKIHYLPVYRAETKIQLSELTGIKPVMIKDYSSTELIKAVVKLRSVKEPQEIEEIEKAIETAYKMHTTAMKMAQPGVIEREISGTIEGIALAHGGPVSFPVILTINGQTLHNHHHDKTLTVGRMLVVDAGAETEMGYASDITRTVPVGGKFDARQKQIYEIVLNANLKAIEAIKPGILYRDIHLLAAKVIATGLKELGLMKGDIDEAVKQGAHALFFPHGLGHHLGLDVHDMESLGENNIGYDEEIQRSSQFGLAFLRMGKRLKEGYVLTVEPGCYFIPALIDMWKAENKFTEFINYDKVETYKNFGGIRIEDDVLVTANGYKVLGKAIPKTVAEIEELMSR